MDIYPSGQARNCHCCQLGITKTKHELMAVCCWCLLLLCKPLIPANFLPVAVTKAKSPPTNRCVGETEAFLKHKLINPVKPIYWLSHRAMGEFPLWNIFKINSFSTVCPPLVRGVGSVRWGTHWLFLNWALEKETFPKDQWILQSGPNSFFIFSLEAFSCLNCG